LNIPVLPKGLQFLGAEKSSSSSGGSVGVSFARALSTTDAPYHSPDT